MIELNLYPGNFNVKRNLHWAPKLLSIPVLVIWIFLAAKLGLAAPWSVLLLFGIVILSLKYVRPLMPDWPKEKLFTGKISFDEDQMIIQENVNQYISKDSIMEFVLFIDYYKDFSIGTKDHSRTGNSMIFIKKSNGTTAFFKFNVANEKQFNHLMKLMVIYKHELPYFKEYKPFEIFHILKPDLSDRIIYGNTPNTNNT